MLMIKKTSIDVSFQFEFFHQWDNAPDSEGFLRNLHRHMMHTTIKVQVFSADRGIEFFALKKHMEKRVGEEKGNWPNASSCEMLALDIALILQEFVGTKKKRLFSVHVSEDGENGGKVAGTIQEGLGVFGE